MIEIKNLSVNRGKFSLNNLSLTIKKGESLALIGPSGAGKTLFLETILGLRRPSTGSVFIDGKNVNMMKPENSSIAYLPQDLALFPHLSVYDNIAFCLRIKSKPKEYTESVVSRLASQLRIDYLLQRKSVANLSGGEKQRVALARALAADPNLVFLDEPFSALDGARRRELHVEVNRLHKEHNFTLVFVTHDLDETLVVANKVALMRKGDIIQTGAPKDMFNNPVSAWAAHFLLFENIFEAEKTKKEGQFRYEDMTIQISKPSELKATSTEKQWLAVKAEAFSVEKGINKRPQNPFFTATSGETFHFGRTEVIELFVNKSKTAKLYGKAPASTIKAGTKVTVEYNESQVKLVKV